MPIVYEKLEIPENYRCSRCAAHGVKLWRQYNRSVPYLELLCCRCADPKRAADMSIDGRSPENDDPPKRRSDQLDDIVGKTGPLVPAVPTVECDTYWGYSAVPVAGCAWWRALPRWPGDAMRPFYVDPADAAAERKMLADHAAYSAQPENYKRDTVFCVKASSHEMHMLWRDFANNRTAQEYGPPTRRRVKWEQLNPGSMPTIGTLDKRPICLTIFWARIDGQVVMFYEVTSELVDWRKIRAWLDAEYKHVPMWDKGTRRPFCDAQNFHLCLTAIDERNKAAATTT